MFETPLMRLTLAVACLTGIAAPEARALDFATVAREVVSSNPRLEARRHEVEAARHRVGPAGAWSSPMVELGVENVPTTGRFDADPMTMKVLGVSQRVPLFGRPRLARASARAAADAEQAGVANASFELQGQALEAYADAYYDGALARRAADHQGALSRLVRSARSRYESGDGRLDDVLRAEAERARNLADFAAFHAEEQAARARLDALRGVPASRAADTLAALPALAIPPLETWLGAISPAHARVEESAASARRYRLAARAARREIWPDLEIGASYQDRGTLRHDVGGLEHGEKQLDMWSARVAFMLPLFAGSRGLEEAAEMEAMARASDADRRAVELELDERIRSAHAAGDAARRTIALLADTVLATQSRAVDASWVSYTAGTTDLFRVLEATHALYAEDVALLRARQDLARAAARLLSLTGRGDLVGIATPAGERNDR